MPLLEEEFKDAKHPAAKQRLAITKGRGHNRTMEWLNEVGAPTPPASGPPRDHAVFPSPLQWSQTQLETEHSSEHTPVSRILWKTLWLELNTFRTGEHLWCSIAVGSSSDAATRLD